MTRTGPTPRVDRTVLATIQGAALLGVCLLGAPGAAAAQDCGTWRQPVVCEAELVAIGDDGRGTRLGARSRLHIAPRDVVELVVEARDQRGRRFPAEYLALHHDGRGCGRLLILEAVEAGLRVRGRAEADRCRLRLWMPGNLNFEWEVEFTVDPRARTQYGRAQAEAVVHALYRGILGRDPDAPSVRTAVTEVQLGNLERLVASIVGSSEFRNGQNGVSPEELLDRFYLGILGRRSDTSGVRTYLDTVRAGRHADVVMNLIQSAEFERRLP